MHICYCRGYFLTQKKRLSGDSLAAVGQLSCGI